MIRGEEVEALTAAAYEAGASVIDVAELVIKVLVGESGLTCDHCRRLLARQIMAGLLNAGWRPPATGLDQIGG